MRPLLLLAFLLVQADASAYQSTVRAVNGDVMLARDGQTIQLTSSGRDSQPVFSSDMQHIAFVRAANAGEPEDLWVVDIKRSLEPRPLHIEASAAAKSGEVASILQVQFSPDASSIYFYTQPGNFGLILKVNEVTGTVDLVSHSVIPLNHQLFEVVQRGNYAGDLIVQKDSHKLAPGRLFLYWLVDRDGRDVAIIGNSPADLSAFRDQIH